MFQSWAFQSNGFQEAGTAANDNLLGGKDYSYVTPNQKHEHEQREKIKRQKSELEKLESVLKETQRKKEVAAKNKLLAAEETKAAKRLQKIELELLEEINRLLILRAELIQRIREEEGVLIVLLMMKKRRLRAA